MFYKKLFISLKTLQYSISVFLMWLIYSHYKVPVFPVNGNYILSLLIKFNVINLIIFFVFVLTDKILYEYNDDYNYGDYNEDSVEFFGIIFGICMSIATLGVITGIVITILFN